MDDSRSWRHDEHVGEGGSAPLEEGESLDVAFVFQSLVFLLRVIAPGKVDLHNQVNMRWKTFKLNLLHSRSMMNWGQYFLYNEHWRLLVLKVSGQ